jgi:cytochrome c oxidase subunit 4
MKEPEAHIVPQKTFLKVWLGLLALTAITVTVAELHLGRLSTLTALAIASLKAGLVLWFFMHLKYESRLFKWLLLAPIVTIAVIIGLTFLDIWYR